jgi:hypothetical protein
MTDMDRAFHRTERAVPIMPPPSSNAAPPLLVCGEFVLLAL